MMTMLMRRENNVAVLLGNMKKAEERKIERKFRHVSWMFLNEKFLPSMSNLCCSVPHVQILISISDMIKKRWDVSLNEKFL